ncbi:MAG: translation initiation factor IF-2 [Spirochaetaceae bacterium]
MAEEQEQNKKPKATLIKHRKSDAPGESGDEPKRKKPRIVVKRKAKSTSPDETATPAKSSEPPATPPKPDVETPHAPGAGVDSVKPADSPRADTPQEETVSPSPGDAQAGGSDRVPEGEAPQAATGPEAPKSEVPNESSVEKAPPEKSADAPTAATKEGDGKEPATMRQTVRRQTFRRQPTRPSPAPFRRTGGTGRHVSSSELEARAERADSRPVSPEQRSPRPGGFSGPRPGGPPRGGTGSGPPPAGPAAAGGKQGGRKFIKSKRKDGGYQKREQQPEKQIYYNKKRTQQQRANPVPKQIDIMEVVTVSELARKMNLKASDIIGKLMGMGMMVTINQQIDAETAEIVASEYGCSVNVVNLYDETLIATPEDTAEELQPRPAIVTVMGHVDHGKTKLLDGIRKTNVAGGEFGGITQHIGAYQVETEHGKLTFLDTPGHEAFTLMRARGANITDIVILVVAANDGVMPQTIEAIDHAKEAKVPIIVALNKTDLPDINVDRVKQQLSELDLTPEEWGGSTLLVPISALKGTGVADLLETVALQAELLDLKANYNCRAEGKIIETRIDAGRGTVSSVLIERGTLRVGDSFVAGVYPGRVRAMFNDRGERIDEASPSMPVEILGLTGIPEAGDPFQVTESERMARQVGDKRQELRKLEDARNVKKVTLDNLYDTIQEGNVQELKVVVKGDVHGSVEALKSSLEGLSTPEIKLTAIRAAAGAINENDVMLASASNAVIVGFHVRPTPRASEIADREKVEIRKYSIIYDAIDDIRTAMEGMLAPELREETVATVEVRETFKVPKIGIIAGCFVKTGTVTRNAQAHVIRDGVEIFTGKINSLKRFKDDVREVKAGYECGLGIANLNDLKPGDEIEVFQITEISRKLSAPVKASKSEKR